MRSRTTLIAAAPGGFTGHCRPLHCPFDMDGTLLLSSTAHVAAVVEALREVYGVA